MNPKVVLFNLGVSIVVSDLEKKSNSKYGISSYKVWNVIENILEKGQQLNIPGYREKSNVMDSVFAGMGLDPKTLALAVSEAENVSDTPT